MTKYYDSIREYAKEKLKNIDFEFLGGMQNQQVYDYYKSNKVDVFVNVSYSEGLPVTIIEGQAAGLTCLCSNAVTREVDITGNCRFLKIDSTSDWVSELKKCRFSKREDTKNRVVEAGYDINTTAKWLENYYLGLDKG